MVVDPEKHDPGYLQERGEGTLVLVCMYCKFMMTIVLGRQTDRQRHPEITDVAKQTDKE